MKSDHILKTLELSDDLIGLDLLRTYRSGPTIKVMDNVIVTREEARHLLNALYLMLGVEGTS